MYLRAVVDTRVASARTYHRDPQPRRGAVGVPDGPLGIGLDPGEIEGGALETERLEHNLVDVGCEVDTADPLEHQRGQVESEVRIRVTIPNGKLQPCLADTCAVILK